MLEYASQDVVYLPHLFAKLQERLFLLQITPGTFFGQISDKYNFYATINKDESAGIKLALIKNIQKDIIYCALNNGMTGVIIEKIMLEKVKVERKVGDFIEVQSLGKNDKNQVVLSYLNGYEYINDSATLDSSMSPNNNYLEPTSEQLGEYDVEEEAKDEISIESYPLEEEEKSRDLSIYAPKYVKLAN